MEEKLMNYIMVVSGFSGEKKELLNLLVSQLEMDSMEKVSYVIMIEEEFNIFFADNDIEEIDYNHTVKELVESTINIIKRKI